ncbi:MAG: hypothetical protein ACPGXK_09360 [Phycisphaerae bacterium]
MDIDFVLLVSRALHLLAVMAAVGGAIFQRVALSPADQVDEGIIAAQRARWSKVIFSSIGVIMLTGFLNFWILAIQPKVEPMPYHALFGLKFLLAMGIFFLASALAGRSEGLASFRQKASSWLSIVIVLAVVIVLLSGVMSQVRQAGAKDKEPVVTLPTATPGE